jgi:hypothetical protein
LTVPFEYFLFNGAKLRQTPPRLFANINLLFAKFKYNSFAPPSAMVMVSRQGAKALSEP